SADLYEGKFQSKVDINGAKRPPTLSISQTLTGVSLAPLTTDLAGIDAISGSAKITASLTTQGNSTEELTRGLNGKLGFDITDGTLKEINIDRSVCLAKQGLNSLKGSDSLEACPPDQPTRFTFFLANATITAGVLKNDDLFIEQARSDSEKFMHIKGNGSVDLNQEKINYRVTASQVRKLAQGGYETRGTPIPVKISGSFADPSVKPDVSGLIKTQLKSKLQQKLEQQLQKKSDADEPESAKDQLKNQLLRGLFN
ncbi:MAG: AsmA family protein, partial [Gammaproteobacteria bacterium]|nr:AsmA family protein [Gammaproteobacteria bacterium]